MSNRPLFTGKPTVEVDQERYDTLVAAEERLYILAKAIQKLNFYNADFETFKRLFDLDEKLEITPDIDISIPNINEGKAPEGENA